MRIELILLHTFIHLPVVWNLSTRVEASDVHGSSALVWASRAGHTKVILLEHQNAMSVLSFLLSIFAILPILFKVVEILLEHNAAPDALGMYQLSALAWATLQGHQDAISALLR